MSRKVSAGVRVCGLCIACATALYIALSTPARGSESAKELAQRAGVIFASKLADIPGKNLAVVALEFPPAPAQQAKAPQKYIGHRHPGSVYVYVIKGTLRLGIEGQPIQVVGAGKSFFEPVGALHTVAENASATEPASAIAVMIVPEGAPLLTPVESEKE